MDSEAQGFKREFEKQKKLASDILKLSGVPEDDVVELFRLALESVEVGD